jgi:four helix bundle protein
MGYQLALDIYQVTKTFPKEEKYSLTDQIRRSSRSIPANLAEAWKKRRYEKAFISKLVDCAGEAGETEVWLDFSKDFGYLTEDRYQDFMNSYDEVNRMLYGMIDKADKFCH